MRFSPLVLLAGCVLTEDAKPSDTAADHTTADAACPDGWSALYTVGEEDGCRVGEDPPAPTTIVCQDDGTFLVPAAIGMSVDLRCSIAGSTFSCDGRNVGAHYEDLGAASGAFAGSGLEGSYSLDSTWWNTDTGGPSTCSSNGTLTAAP